MSDLHRLYGEPGDRGTIVSPARWKDPAPNTAVPVEIAWDGDTSGWRHFEMQARLYPAYRAGDRIIVTADGAIVKAEDEA